MMRISELRSFNWMALPIRNAWGKETDNGRMTFVPFVALGFCCSRFPDYN